MGADPDRPAAVYLELPPEPASVTQARHAIAGLAQRLGAPQDDVALAVSEAVGNAVVHAFRDGEPGKIEVSAEPQPGTLVITVSDNGGGMSPDMNSRGLGMGITLIAQVAGDVRFQSSDRGTAVSMRFDIPSGDDRAPEQPSAREGRRG